MSGPANIQTHAPNHAIVNVAHANETPFPLLALPKDLLAHVFYQLNDPELLVRLREVCKEIIIISDDPFYMNSTWKKLFNNIFKRDCKPVDSFQLCYKRHHIFQQKLKNDASFEELDIQNAPLKALAFMDSQLVSQPLTSVHEMPNDHPLLCFNGMYAMTEEENKIKVVNPQNGNIKLLEDHKRPIYRLIYADEMLIATSMDGSITVFNSELKVIYTLDGSMNEFDNTQMQHVAFADGKLFCATHAWNMTTIKVINPITGQCLYIQPDWKMTPSAITMDDGTKQQIPMRIVSLHCTGKKLIATMQNPQGEREYSWAMMWDLKTYDFLKTAVILSPIFKTYSVGEMLITCSRANPDAILILDTDNSRPIPAMDLNVYNRPSDAIFNVGSSCNGVRLSTHYFFTLRNQGTLQKLLTFGNIIFAVSNNSWGTTIETHDINTCKLLNINPLNFFQRTNRWALIDVSEGKIATCFHGDNTVKIKHYTDKRPRDNEHDSDMQPENVKRQKTD